MLFGNHPSVGGHRDGVNKGSVTQYTLSRQWRVYSCEPYSSVPLASNLAVDVRRRLRLSLSSPGLPKISCLADVLCRHPRSRAPNGVASNRWGEHTRRGEGGATMTLTPAMIPTRSYLWHHVFLRARGEGVCSYMPLLEALRIGFMCGLDCPCSDRVGVLGRTQIS